MDETTPTPEDVGALLPDLSFLHAFIQDGRVRVDYVLDGVDENYTYRPHLPLKRLAQAVLGAQALYDHLGTIDRTQGLLTTFTEIAKVIATAGEGSPPVVAFDDLMGIFHPALMAKLSHAGVTFMDVFDLEEAARLIYPFFAKYAELMTSPTQA